MDITQFSSTDRDSFGRKYPVKIILKKNDEILYGHIKSSMSQGSEILEYINLLVIDNIEDWEKNKINKGERAIKIDSKDIREISVHKNY